MILFLNASSIFATPQKYFMEHEQIQNLIEALSFSPDNIPLRLHLADTYMSFKMLGEAEEEFKKVLSHEEDNQRAKTGLAHIYFKQEKYSAASVILEEMLHDEKASKNALVLYCRVLLKEAAIGDAVEIYKKVLELDPSFTDAELDSRLRQVNYPAELPGSEEADEDALRILEKPTIDFDDVGGMHRVKDEIDLKIIRPLNHPELYKAYGKKIGGGILLYGPPGCGKTHLARATAGQIDSKFISIGINDILDMWIGNSEKNLHEVFELARRNTPCVLFFDEVDALGASRTDMRTSAGRQLINQFLSELDGVKSNNEGVLVLAATNAPWHMDPAFRRPGRFDRIIFVEPPDAEGRARILEILMKGKPAERVDYVTLAKSTEDFSGADLKAVVDIAIEEKLRNSFKDGIPTPVTTKDLQGAIKKHRPSTKEWFSTARNYALYANDSGLYDDILAYLKIKK
jgi:SpoVK/Ycf46/Vps4 family AAA+-type ATPase